MNRLNNWYASLLTYCQHLENEFDQIPEKRRTQLERISFYISDNSDSTSQIIVICTHNSRRSHFGQIWLKVAAEYYGITLDTFSGGTEATAFHPNAVNAIERCGFQAEATGDVSNPTYKIDYGRDRESIHCFSKKFDHESNPDSGFAAIMVCNSAAEACPFVPGAKSRFVLPYDDPKEFDGTEQEQLKYDERCHEIARDMFFVVKNV